MKNLLTNNAIWKSALSFIVIGFFLFLAISSGYYKTEEVHIGNGVYEKTIWVPTTNQSEHRFYRKIGTCKKDNYGRWHGNMVIETIYEGEDDPYKTERVPYVNGERHGTSVRTYEDGTTYSSCYNTGMKWDCDDLEKKDNEFDNAFDLFAYKYPWYLEDLNCIGFNRTYIVAFIDTVESVMSENNVNIEDFDSYYDDAIDILEETPYDSIIQKHNFDTFHRTIELTRNSEFNLATVDHYRSLDKSTYNILTSTYPGYIKYLNSLEASNSEIEELCNDYDAVLVSYGELDEDDPFFVDSTFTRMYRALNYLSNLEESSSYNIYSMNKSNTSINSKLSNTLKNIRIKDIQEILDKSPQDLSTLVMSSMFQYYFEADVIRKAVFKAYAKREEIVIPSTVTTTISNNTVTIEGYIIDNGGGEIISKGIVWSKFYNPTIEDNNVKLGSGDSNFNYVINGLTKGESYYTRAYAKNNVGISYGNCINFIAGSTMGLVSNKLGNQIVNIYPNPASTTLTISLETEIERLYNLKIIDLSGKVVLSKDLKTLEVGENNIQLNVSTLARGDYILQLSVDNYININKTIILN